MRVDRDRQLRVMNASVLALTLTVVTSEAKSLPRCSRKNITRRGAVYFARLSAYEYINGTSHERFPPKSSIAISCEPHGRNEERQRGH